MGFDLLGVTSSEQLLSNDYSLCFPVHFLLYKQIEKYMEVLVWEKLKLYHTLLRIIENLKYKMTLTYSPNHLWKENPIDRLKYTTDGCLNNYHQN